MSDEAHHALGDVLGARRDGEPSAILRPVRVARGVVDGAVAAPFLDDPELIVDCGLRTEDGEDRLDDRQVHDLPAARRVAGAQRDEGRAGCCKSRDAVREPEGRERRRPVRLPSNVGEAAHGLGQSPEPGTVPVRAALSEACDAGEDQAGVYLAEPLVAEVPALEDLLSLGLAQVQGDRPLVAAEHLPPQADSIFGVPVRPRRVAPRVLDLQDLGPEVPKHRRGERPGEERGRVYDLYAFERLPLRQRPAPLWISAPNRPSIFAHAPSRRKVLTGSRTPAMFAA